MDSYQRVLTVDAATSFYRMNRFPVGDFFGPVDLGLHLAGKQNSLNIGVGLLAGSIFPGSNRLIFSGFSPCWGGFYISSMGGAGLVFDNLGINMLSIIGKAHTPSVLYLNRCHGEEVQVELVPVDIATIWKSGRGGVYSLMDDVYAMFGSRYEKDPRILAAGPAAMATDTGAICSAPMKNGKISHADTWAGRGGFGSKLLQEHGIAAVIFGGTVVDEDFRDRKVADDWFQNKYETKLLAKDLEATSKYRFEPRVETGGTFGVNFATLAGGMLSFNYRSIYMTEEQRLRINKDFIIDHYLKQFNEETIRTRQQTTCGEPCSAVCKKLRGEFKKDYEPYQVFGPLAGVFDQRAAERLTHHADMLGFDAISAGGVVCWLMDCLADGVLSPQELGVSDVPVFSPDNFDIIVDSSRNADIGIGLLDAIIERKGIVDLSEGARKFARRLSRSKGKEVLDRFVYNAFARKGWMVPNQYWTPGVLSPMSIMGKYYMHYGGDFVPPRELGRKNAARMTAELVLDNIGICRFHRQWAEEMVPEIIGYLYGQKEEYLKRAMMTASRINCRNSSVYWESERCVDFVHMFLQRKKEVDGSTDPELLTWLDRFDQDRAETAFSFWYEIHKGIQESLREF
jgi:glyceraldehyde-3-phosphate dehydrogenase (ferredoxin)